MKTETKQLARAIFMELAALGGQTKCEWISEARAIEEFPFSKEKLRDLRRYNKIEYRYHWKHTDNSKSAMGQGRSSAIIYHRQRMIDYIESL